MDPSGTVPTAPTVHFPFPPGHGQGRALQGALRWGSEDEADEVAGGQRGGTEHDLPG
jgi:hypothetical protein